MTQTKKPFAEVIESYLDHYKAQCWTWDHFPSFGSLVCVTDTTKTYFGIVTHMQTGSSDPMRSPFAYQKTEEELRAQQPQIFEFLKTDFTVNLVGYEQKDIDNQPLCHFLPPTPCKIHAFVTECSTQDYARFFSSFDFLPLLFAYAATITNIDELLMAIIKQLVDRKLFSQETVDPFCMMFNQLTGNDYRRLKLLLKRIQTILD